MTNRMLMVGVLVWSGVAAAAPALNSAQIEQLTGAKGKLDEKEGVFKVSVPRADLKVVAGGVHLTPPMGLTTWAAFTKSGAHTMVMGDMCLTEDQVNPVMSVALDNGLEVTALHNHFFWDSPKVMFMHIGGMGDETQLATAVGKVFAKIKDTAGGKGEVPKVDIDPAKTSLDPAKIEAVLGTKGELANGVYKVTIGRTTKMSGHAVGKTMGVNTWAAFAGSDDQAIVDGDFAMLESELQGVLKSLRGAGIDVVAIHQHMTGEQPRVMFLHYWGIGRTTDLANGLKAALAKTASAWAQQPQVTPLSLPDGKGGIGFDDLRYDAASNALLIPAGRTGNVDLIDPSTKAVTPIGGFSKIAKFDAGHGQSVTSVDVGDGYLFATDRTALKLDVVDSKTRKIVLQVPLASAPDYVRYVASTHEIWVTEPGKKRIEVFALSKATPPVPTHSGFVDTPGGPESLAVDVGRGRAYTHKWKESTMAIDLKTRKIAATWAAGCGDPRGIWSDDARGFLLVGCEDGTATVLDVDHDGKVLSTVKSGSGVDIIAYDGKRAHLYLPGDESATMAIIGVSAKGALTILGVIPTVKDAHCVTTDDHGNAYVCDPGQGQLLIVRDPYPAAGS